MRIYLTHKLALLMALLPASLTAQDTTRLEGLGLTEIRAARSEAIPRPPAKPAQAEQDVERAGSEQAFRWAGGLQDVPAWRCQGDDGAFQAELNRAELKALELAGQGGYHECTSLAPLFYYRPRQRECEIMANLLCRPGAGGNPPGGCGGAESKVFSWTGKAGGLPRQRCQSGDLQIREVEREATETAVAMAVQSGYPYCRTLFSNIYYREKQRECVIQARQICAKSPACD